MRSSGLVHRGEAPGQRPLGLDPVVGLERQLAVTLDDRPGDVVVARQAGQQHDDQGRRQQRGEQQLPVAAVGAPPEITRAGEDQPQAPGEAEDQAGEASTGQPQPQVHQDADPLLEAEPGEAGPGGAEEDAEQEQDGDAAGGDPGHGPR